RAAAGGSLRQGLGYEIAGPRPKPRPGMGAGADVPEPVDVRLVARKAGARAPEQVLIERARPCVDVAADQVPVRRLDVGWRIDHAPQDSPVQVRGVSGNPGLDPVGVGLPEPLRPLAAADVELAGRVATWSRRDLLELDPEDPGA